MIFLSKNKRDGKTEFDESRAYWGGEQSGDLLGVFHDDEIGDIDLVWGSRKENAGLDHIIFKHVGEGKDFLTIDEARQAIEKKFTRQSVG